MDWHHPDWGTRRAWNDKATGTPDMDRYTAYMKAQLRALHGLRAARILWFDGEWEAPGPRAWSGPLQLRARLATQIIVNNRVGKARSGMAGMDKGAERVGDYGTPEQEIPPTGFGPGVDWESCMTMNNHWATTSTTRMEIIHHLDPQPDRLLQQGRQLPAEYRPYSEGVFPDACIERLAAIGKWMKANSEPSTARRPARSRSWIGAAARRRSSPPAAPGLASTRNAARAFEGSRGKSGAGVTRLYFLSITGRRMASSSSPDWRTGRSGRSCSLGTRLEVHRRE